MTALPDYFIGPFAFALGFALTRASTCTVAATKRLVNYNKPDWVVGISIAVCWSGLTLLILGALFPDYATRSFSAPIDETLIAASIIMGIGAYLNNGCFIGSIGRISGGESSYLLAFAGLVVARTIGDGEIFAPLTGHLQAVHMPEIPQLFVWLWASVFVIGSCYGIVVALRKRQQAIMALCLMGVFAALVFVINPNWTYEAWIGRMVAGQGFSKGLQIEFAVLALFTGAILSRTLKGQFVLKPPELSRMALCFCGGILMGLGAIFVPGGNDTLLLWTIPSFALHGLVAYVTMVLTVAVIALIGKQYRKATDQSVSIDQSNMND